MGARTGASWGIAVGTALGVAVTWAALGGRARPARAASSPDAIEPPPACGGAGRPQIVLSPVTARLGEDDRVALRALIREELQAVRASQTSPAGDAAPPDPETTVQALEPNARSAYDAANVLVEAALRTRSWTERDKRKLEKQLVGLPHDLYGRIVGPLIVAVNRGDVRFEGRGPLL
jgi:hypothetical protein